MSACFQVCLCVKRSLSETMSECGGVEGELVASVEGINHFLCALNNLLSESVDQLGDRETSRQSDS